MNQKDYTAFTNDWNGKTSTLISDVGVSLPFNPKIDTPGSHPTVKQYNAIWDTGATGSVVTKDVALALGLKPISKTEVHGVGGTKVENVYLVNIYLPNKVALHHVRVTECEKLTGDGMGVLIGMDIIGTGDFAVTHVDEKTKMSFRIPSIRSIDFVKEAERDKAEREKKHSALNKKELREKHRKERKNKKKGRKK
ncbi:MAG: hypothetical protein AUK58_01000 [Candidatus Moranbacteria bacterium CG2_30_41_165]|nr:MAG: hypothetical protein AUK58_01000 [Candidatus Moranbacteria bacterium CG2_30_41_165]